MKNLMKLIGIIAFAVVIGFTMAACGDESDDDNGGGTGGGGGSGGSGGGTGVSGIGGGGGGGAVTDPALNGKWNYTFVITSQTHSYILNNGAITWQRDGGDVMKGGFSTSGNSITITYTHYNVNEDKGSTSWKTKEESRAYRIQQYADEYEILISESETQYGSNVDTEMNNRFKSDTGTYTVSGNTLTITIDKINLGTETVLTKQ